MLIHSDAGSDAASSPYKNQVSVNGQHHFVVDEPASVGGKNLGPNPYGTTWILRKCSVSRIVSSQSQNDIVLFRFVVICTGILHFDDHTNVRSKKEAALTGH